MDLPVNELDTVRQDITAAKAKLAKAEEEGDRELITAYVKLLAGLQEEKNRLSQSQGKLICKIPIDGCSFNICCLLLLGFLTILLLSSFTHHH
jgi:hypothetical protein